MEMIANAGTAPAAPKLFADGIYFGLDEAPYHRDPALGSSDLKRLYNEPADYWFGSVLNPNRAEEETSPAQLIGKAVHKLVLEGRDALDARFECYPTGDDLLITADDLAGWLKDKGEKPGKTKAASIEAIRALCEAGEIEQPRILDALLRKAADAGRSVLKADDYARIMRAGDIILGNPHLSRSFVGGKPEVSIFWTEEIDGEPVRRKARFDYLKPRAITDLKSISPQGGSSFAAACRKAIANYFYHTQSAAYLHARAQIPALVAAGAVFGEHDPEWLDQVAAAEDYAFVFVFWTSNGAPLTWGGILSPGNGILDHGESQVAGALWNYVAARRRHGLSSPWIDPQPLAEIELEHMPGWFGR